MSFLQIKVKVNLVLIGNGQSREIGVFGHLFGFYLFYCLHLRLGSRGLLPLLWQSPFDGAVERIQEVLGNIEIPLASSRDEIFLVLC